MEYPQRKRPIHLPSVERLNRSTIQFVTVCTHQKLRVLANDHAHHLLRCFWQDDSVYRVGRDVIMLDHIHLFCAPNTWPEKPLSLWASYWKSRSASQWKGLKVKKLWQKDFWDRQLRGHESYAEKWHYVVNNPVRAGLVEKAEDWPYQGEMYKLSWHD